MKVPLDHVKSFKTLMHLEMTLDEVMSRAFPTTLKGVARVWFSTISNFEQLSERLFFISYEDSTRKKPTGYMLNIRQIWGESLRQYVNCFNKEVL